MADVASLRTRRAPGPRDGAGPDGPSQASGSAASAASAGSARPGPSSGHAGSVAKGCDRVGGMDLRAWIVADHASVRTRFDQAVKAHVPTGRWRERPGEAGSSIAWLLLHGTWHQDLAITTAVQGRAPLLERHRGALGLAAHAPHEGLSEAEQVAVTAGLDLEALDAYAASVADETAAWLATVDLAVLDQVPPAGERIEQLGGVTAGAVPWLHAMWEGKDVGWFVRWEAIGHRHGHLGEMVSVRSRLGLSPF